MNEAKKDLIGQVFASKADPEKEFNVLEIQTKLGALQKLQMNLAVICFGECIGHISKRHPEIMLSETECINRCQNRHMEAYQIARMTYKENYPEELTPIDYAKYEKYLETQPTVTYF